MKQTKIKIITCSLSLVFAFTAVSPFVGYAINRDNSISINDALPLKKINYSKSESELRKGWFGRLLAKLGQAVVDWWIEEMDGMEIGSTTDKAFDLTSVLQDNAFREGLTSEGVIITDNSITIPETDLIYHNDNWGAEVLAGTYSIDNEGNCTMTLRKIKWPSSDYPTDY